MERGFLTADPLQVQQEHPVRALQASQVDLAQLNQTKVLAQVLAPDQVQLLVPAPVPIQALALALEIYWVCFLLHPPPAGHQFLARPGPADPPLPEDSPQQGGFSHNRGDSSKRLTVGFRELRYRRIGELSRYSSQDHGYISRYSSQHPQGGSSLHPSQQEELGQ